MIKTIVFQNYIITAKSYTRNAHTNWYMLHHFYYFGTIVVLLLILKMPNMKTYSNLNVDYKSML